MVYDCTVDCQRTIKKSALCVREKYIFLKQCNSFVTVSVVTFVSPLCLAFFLESLKISNRIVKKN